MARRRQLPRRTPRRRPDPGAAPVGGSGEAAEYPGCRCRRGMREHTGGRPARLRRLRPRRTAILGSFAHIATLAAAGRRAGSHPRDRRAAVERRSIGDSWIDGGPRREPRARRRPPADSIEALIADVWAEFLGREPIGPESFRNHPRSLTLLSAQISNGARNYRSDDPAEDILRHPTVRRLAAESRTRAGGAAFAPRAAARFPAQWRRSVAPAAAAGPVLFERLNRAHHQLPRDPAARPLAVDARSHVDRRDHAAITS